MEGVSNDNNTNIVEYTLTQLFKVQENKYAFFILKTVIIIELCTLKKFFYWQNCVNNTDLFIAFLLLFTYLHNYEFCNQTIHYFFPFIDDQHLLVGSN